MSKKRCAGWENEVTVEDEVCDESLYEFDLHYWVYQFDSCGFVTLIN